MNEFYVEIDKKRKKASNLRLQIDNEFQQTKIKDLMKSTMLPCLRQVFEVEKHWLPNKKLENLKIGYQKLRRYLIDQNLKQQRQQ